MAEIELTKREPPRRTTWRTGDLLRAAVVFAGVYAALQLLWVAHSILFVAFLGILFGLALSAGVDRLEALRLPRGAGAAAIVLASIGLLVLFGALAAPTVREQAEELRIQLPQAIDRLEGWFDERDGTILNFIFPDEEEPGAEGREETGEREGAEESGPDPEGEPGPEGGAGGGDREPGFEAEPGQDPEPDAQNEQEAEGQEAEAQEEEPAAETLRQRLTEQLGDLGAHLFAFLTSTVAVLGGILLILFVAIYVAVDPDTYRRGMLSLVPRHGRARAERVLTGVSLMLRRWLVTQLVAMVLVGAVTSVALWILGVQAALALGILAGVLEFIPIFGPIIAAVPAIAMGFLESPQTALWVTVVYVVVQQLESQLLVPLLMKEGVDLPPVLTVLAQALMALIFGFLGLLIAVPLLAAAVVVVKMLYVQDVVGEEVALPEG